MQPRTIVFDNEAVQALVDVRHRKHLRALTAIETVTGRNLRRDGPRLVVPTTVRVEAGWDRTRPKAAAANQLRIADVALDTESADRAARIRAALGVSVADAHLGAVLETTPGPHAVLTSDADDVRRMSDHVGTAVQVVTI